MELLDRIQSLAAIDAFDPAAYASALVAELSPASTIAELEQRDAQLARALAEIDDTAARIMRIRLEHAANEVAVQTRRVFAQTIVTYAGKLDLLLDRVRGARIAEPDRFVDAARATLAIRDQLRGAALALIGELATAAIPDADRQARDVQLDDAARKQWSRVRRDLEVIARDPARILVAPMAKRVAAWPEQLDDPPAQPEVSFADLIELD